MHIVASSRRRLSLSQHLGEDGVGVVIADPGDVHMAMDVGLDILLSEDLALGMLLGLAQVLSGLEEAINVREARAIKQVEREREVLSLQGLPPSTTRTLKRSLDGQAERVRILNRQRAASRERTAMAVPRVAEEHAPPPTDDKRRQRRPVVVWEHAHLWRDARERRDGRVPVRIERGVVDLRLGVPLARDGRD